MGDWIDGVALCGATSSSLRCVWRRKECVSSALVADGLVAFAGIWPPDYWLGAVNLSAGRWAWRKHLTLEDALDIVHMAVDGDSLYVLLSSRQLLCLKARTGAIRWSLPVQVRGRGLLAQRGLVYAELSPGVLSAVAGPNGELVWEHDFAAEWRAGVADDELQRRVFVCDSVRVGLNSDPDGSPWPPAPLVSAGPVIARDRLFVGLLSGQIACLDAMSGQLQWIRPLQGGPWMPWVQSERLDGADLVTDEGSVYVVRGDTVSALDPETGGVRWSTSLRRQVHDPLAVHAAGLFVCSDPGMLHRLSAVDGRLVWSRHLVRAPGIRVSEWSRPAMGNGAVLTAVDVEVTRPRESDYLSYLCAVSLGGRKLWQCPISEFGRDVAVLDNGVLMWYPVLQRLAVGGRQ